MMSGWIWTDGHIVGDLNYHETVYHWNQKYYPSRSAAIKAGLREYGSDDFNVAQVIDGRIAWFGWMDEKHPAGDYPAVARALGLRGGVR